jgi:cytochrome c biogenesis protein CcdA
VFVARALVVGAALTAGFIAVFATLGTIVQLGARTIVLDAGAWVTVGIGVVLVVLGIAILFGYRIPLLLPKVSAGGSSRSMGSIFVFGVSYAIASLGCTLPTFLGVAFGGGRRNGVVSGLVTFLLYSLGMGLLVTALTVSLAVASGSLLRVLRGALRFVDQMAGVFLLLAGLYLTWYGYIEATDRPSGAVVERATSLSTRAQSWLQERGPVAVAVTLGIVIALAAGTVVLRRRPTPAGDTTGDTPSATSGARPVGSPVVAPLTSVDHGGSPDPSA